MEREEEEMRGISYFLLLYDIFLHIPSFQYDAARYFQHKAISREAQEAHEMASEEKEGVYGGGMV